MKMWAQAWADRLSLKAQVGAKTLKLTAKSRREAGDLALIVKVGEAHRG